MDSSAAANLIVGLIVFGVGLAIMFGIFLAIREIVLWYWRLNDIANNLTYIADYYRRREGQLPALQPKTPPTQPAQLAQPSQPGNPFAPQSIQPRRNP